MALKKALVLGTNGQIEQLQSGDQLAGSAPNGLNFCTLNPSDDSAGSLSNGNLTLTTSAGSSAAYTQVIYPQAWQIEFTLQQVPSSYLLIGFGHGQSSITSGGVVFYLLYAGAWSLVYSTGGAQLAGTVSGLAAPSVNDVYNLAVNPYTGAIGFTQNGTAAALSVATAPTYISYKALAAAASSTSCSITINAGPTFAHPQSGYGSAFIDYQRAASRLIPVQITSSYNVYAGQNTLANVSTASGGVPISLGTGTDGQIVTAIKSTSDTNTITFSGTTNASVTLASQNDTVTYEYSVAASSWLLTSSALAFNANPMTTAGDTIYGGASGTPIRLAKGTTGQFYTMSSGGDPQWQTINYISNPMTTAGDIIVGGAGGTPTRLAIGSTGQVPMVSGGTLVYGTIKVTPNFSIKTGSYNPVAGTDNSIGYNLSGSATATVPDATTCSGQIFTLLKLDATTNALTINTTSSQSINGVMSATSTYLVGKGDFLTLQSNGANWDLIAWPAISRTLFTGSGTINSSRLWSQIARMRLLGGGGGGSSGPISNNSNISGGGPGGGGSSMCDLTRLPTELGYPLTVTIGAGGAGGAAVTATNASASGNAGGNGGNSTVTGSAVFSAHASSGGVLTVDSVTSGTVQVGMLITGSGITPPTYITGQTGSNTFTICPATVLSVGSTVTGTINYATAFGGDGGGVPILNSGSFSPVAGGNAYNPFGTAIAAVTSPYGNGYQQVTPYSGAPGLSNHIEFLTKIYCDAVMGGCGGGSGGAGTMSNQSLPNGLAGGVPVVNVANTQRAPGTPPFGASGGALAAGDGVPFGWGLPGGGGGGGGGGYEGTFNVAVPGGNGGNGSYGSGGGGGGCASAGTASVSSGSGGNGGGGILYYEEIG